MAGMIPDFRALIEEPTPRSAYRGLKFPVLVMRGEHTPAPTRIIANDLSRPCHDCSV